jgi:hypothetical protein
MAHLPKDYIVGGGGKWLDIDYSNIDFNYPNLKLTSSPDGWLVLAKEKITSSLSPEGAKLEIGRGFESKAAARRESRLLEDFAEYNVYPTKAGPGEQMCSHTFLGPEGAVEGEDVTFSCYVPENERSSDSCNNLATMTFLNLDERDHPDETDRRYACDDRYHHPQICRNLVRLDGRTECRYCGVIFAGKECPKARQEDGTECPFCLAAPDDRENCPWVSLHNRVLRDRSNQRTDLSV